MTPERHGAETDDAELIPRAEADEMVRNLTETLEARVRARTDDLRAANERLLKEIDVRRAAEEKLRESEELYRYTVELSQQLAWTATPDGKLLSVSRGMVAVTGLRGKTALATGWAEIIHPDDRDQLFAAWERALKAQRPGRTEFRMRVADGTYRTFRANAAPRVDDKGDVIRWYGFTEDIHDQKLADIAREEAEERYRLAARATNDAIWDLDLVSNLIRWSESAAETLGYPGKELGTTPMSWWEERVHPEDRPRATSSLNNAIRKGRTRWSETYRFRQASGAYGTYLDRGFMVPNSEGESVRIVGAMVDLTERQRAEEEVRRMQAELIHVSRLSAMGTMASTLAHEINQPLTAVTNYVRGSRRLIENSAGHRLDEVREALAAAEGGALRAGQIVRRLRELVARGTAEVQAEELPKLIEDAGVLAFVDANVRGIQHRVELDPEAVWVEADAIQVQQVLINLIRNAVQAVQEAERREIVVSTRAASEMCVEVSVADTGPGISPEVREALFTAFQGTKADGLGIGLSISRTIVEAHGGKIWAEDREGGGTIFRFTLRRWNELESAR